MTDLSKIKGVIWHHFGGTDANPLASTLHHTVDTVDASHMTRWPGFQSLFYRNKNGRRYHVGYNTIIELPSGKRTMTRRYGEQTAAARGYNDGWIHVATSGNFDVGADKWKKEYDQFVIREWEIIKRACPHLKISDNHPHRKFAAKTCFGSSRPDDHI